MLEKLEALMSKYIPWVYLDGVSSVLHGLVLLGAMLLINWAPVYAASFGATIAGILVLYFYHTREDKDTAEARLIVRVFERKRKLRDSKLDRYFPTATFVLGLLMVWL